MEAVTQVPSNQALWSHGQYRTMYITAVIGGAQGHYVAFMHSSWTYELNKSIYV